MRRFASSRARPTPVDFLSAADRWQQWGWTVSVAPVTPGFNRLRHARKGGFTLTGTGRATVRTPSVYPSGVRARVTVIGKTGRSSTDLTAGPTGALRIPVPLSHDATPGTTRVAIRLRPHLGER